MVWLLVYIIYFFLSHTAFGVDHTCKYFFEVFIWQRRCKMVVSVFFEHVTLPFNPSMFYTEDLFF